MIPSVEGPGARFFGAALYLFVTVWEAVTLPARLVVTVVDWLVSQ